MWGAGPFALRVGLQWVQAKRKGHRFDAFDRPSPIEPSSHLSDAGSFHEEPQDGQEHNVPWSVSPQSILSCRYPVRATAGADGESDECSI